MKRILSPLFLGLAVMLGLSMAAFAQDPQISYTGGYQPVLYGYGVGLYSGTLNGAATKFVCDDATLEIGNGSTRNTNARIPSQLGINAPPLPTTPEPLSMALMGTFLTLAGLALGKKKLIS